MAKGGAHPEEMCPLDVKRGEMLWVQGALCSQAQPALLLTFSISYSALPFHLCFPISPFFFLF